MGKFLIGGLIIEASDNVKIKPTVLTKMTQGAPVSIDATVEALINDKWSVWSVEWSVE